MDLRRGWAVCLLAAVPAHSQTAMPNNASAGAIPSDVSLSVPASGANVGAAAQLNLSAGESVLLSLNSLYSSQNPAAAGSIAGQIDAINAAGVMVPSDVLAGARPEDSLPPVRWPEATLNLPAPAPRTFALAVPAATPASETASTAPSLPIYNKVNVTEAHDPVSSMEISNLSVILIPTNAPVPEPSVWALGALGVGIAGWLRRRKQA